MIDILLSVNRFKQVFLFTKNNTPSKHLYSSLPAIIIEDSAKKTANIRKEVRKEMRVGEKKII